MKYMQISASLGASEHPLNTDDRVRDQGTKGKSQGQHRK